MREYKSRKVQGDRKEPRTPHTLLPAIKSKPQYHDRLSGKQRVLGNDARIIGICEFVSTSNRVEWSGDRLSGGPVSITTGARVISRSFSRLCVPNSDDLDTVTRYFWDISLCQALYPSLGLLEVAVRNSIDATLAVHFGRSDWYDTPGFLQNREAIRVGRAKKKIQDSRKLVAPGRVVAELNLGFWTSLLDTLYGNSPYGPQVWKSPSRPLLIAAFPNAPNCALGVRRPILNRLDDIRLLRNRIFHHE